MKTKTTAPKTTAPKTTATRGNAQTANTQEIAMKTKTHASTKSPSHSTPAPSLPTQWDSLYVKLLDELRPELDAVAPGALLTVNVDVPTAIHYARSALPVLELLRPQVVTLGAGADLKLYDRVGDYARLLQYAHGCYLAAIDPTDTVEQTYEAVVSMRDFLLAWGVALVASKLLPQALIDRVGTGVGHQNAVTALTLLTSALRASWAQIEGKTMIKASQLDEADALAEKLAEGVARRDSLAETLTKRATDRQLAFTLFVRAYAEARAIAIFLRRKEGDGDKLVPSIYSKAPSARRTEEPVAPAPAPAGPVDAAKPVLAPKPDEDVPLNQSSPFALAVKS